MELAVGWEVKDVVDALVSEPRAENRLKLARFLQERYNQRFFDPISILEREAVRDISWPKDDKEPSVCIRPYGFAIMSLACQIIETLESYRRGIPTTNRGDFGKMIEDPNYKNSPTTVTCKEQEIPGTRKAFNCFFENYSYDFPKLRGDEFYENVRNSLLHQSQTRKGWVINIHQYEDAPRKTYEVYVVSERILYRDSFISQLRCCFGRFIEHLMQHRDKDDVWKNPERKIWWIAWLSSPEYLIRWVEQNPVHARSKQVRDEATP